MGPVSGRAWLSLNQVTVSWWKEQGAEQRRVTLLPPVSRPSPLELLMVTAPSETHTSPQFTETFPQKRELLWRMFGVLKAQCVDLLTSRGHLVLRFPAVPLDLSATF